MRRVSPDCTLCSCNRSWGLVVLNNHRNKKHDTRLHKLLLPRIFEGKERSSSQIRRNLERTRGTPTISTSHLSGRVRKAVYRFFTSLRRSNILLSIVYPHLYMVSNSSCPQSPKASIIEVLYLRSVLFVSRTPAKYARI
jgi:hypothetical protein